MSKKILLADDSVTIQKVVELTFLDRDYQVDAVGSGTEALDRLASARPDLVIADVHMPGANGYEVCRRAKDRDPTLPVLLLVGTFEPFDERAAAEARADAHLKKPFDAQDLLEHAEALLAQSSAMDPAEAPTTMMEFEDEPPTVQTLRPTFGGGPVAVADPPTSEILVDTADVSESVGHAADAFEAPASTADTADVSESAATADEAASATVDDYGDQGIALELDDEEDSPNLVTPPEEDPDSGTLSAFAAPVDEAEMEAGGDDEEPADDSVAAAAVDLAVPEVPALPTLEAPEATEDVAPAENGHVALSDEDVDRIARRVAELLGDKVVREVAWDILPDLAEVAVQERIRELESQVE